MLRANGLGGHKSVAQQCRKIRKRCINRIFGRSITQWEGHNEHQKHERSCSLSFQGIEGKRRRRGLLQPGRSNLISWSRGGERIGSATITIGIRSLRLTYNVDEGSAVAVDEVVNLRSTKTSLADNADGSNVPDAIVAVASCMAGLASAAGSAMACRMSPNLRAVPSAPTGVPARSDNGWVARRL